MTRLVRLGEIADIRPGLGRSGRSAGAREGGWPVKIISVGNIQDDRLHLAQVEEVGIERTARSEQHVLQSDDVLVSARSTVVKAALVPASVSPRTVADATLLVVRANEWGLGAYLWWFLTSAHGWKQMSARMMGSAVLFLPAKSLADIEVPLPGYEELLHLVDLVEASEQAYVAAKEAAQLRRTVFRDAIIDRLRRTTEGKGEMDGTDAE